MIYLLIYNINLWEEEYNKIKKKKTVCTSTMEGCLSCQWISTSFITRATMPDVFMSFLSICNKTHINILNILFCMKQQKVLLITSPSISSWQRAGTHLQGCRVKYFGQTQHNDLARSRSQTPWRLGVQHINH